MSKVKHPFCSEIGYAASKLGGEPIARDKGRTVRSKAESKGLSIVQFFHYFYCMATSRRQQSIQCSEDSNTTAKRRLNELEEAVGRLHTITSDNCTLLLTMDSIQFTIDFPSVQELESTRELLEHYVGRQMGILRFEDPAMPPRIRIIAQHHQEPKGDR